jgi:nitrate reductase delta subunit
MTLVARQQETYLYFADLLDYPKSDLLEKAGICVGLLGPAHPEAAGHIQDFMEFAERTPPGRLEEIYTGTFDISPACYIFAGYILFGESFNRGKFLVRLQKEYRERGFSAGNELADHLAVMFRFMGMLDPDEHTAQLLLKECFVPVLTKMIDSFDDEKTNQNPYRQVLRAVLMVLEQTQKTVPIM